MQRESALLAEYRALLASPTINHEGVEVDYYSYVAVPFMLIIPGLLLLLRKREVRMSENNVEKD